jgi:class 3 adenylate cyclase
VDGNYQRYNFADSLARLDEILSPSNNSFDELDSLPSRDRLTFTNGFYGYCSAIFVDVRGSSELPSKYQRRVLARIYRAFISETVALLNGESSVREVNIVGDCVWAVYNTAQKPQIDDVFNIAAQVNILENVLAFKMKRAGYEAPIQFGIGLSYGRALMIKAGHKGSTINDVVYMGDVVNEAAHLADLGGKGASAWSGGSPRIHMNGVFRQNLNEHNQSLTQLVSSRPREVYSSDAVNTAIRDWLEVQ